MFSPASSPQLPEKVCAPTSTPADFGLAHVFWFALAHGVALDEHLSVSEVRHIAGREWTLIGAALPPIAGLLLGTVGVFEAATAFGTALAVGIVVLAAQAIYF